MISKRYDLEDRIVEFAGNIVFFCKDLPNDRTGDYYGNQLLRSAGSAALNWRSPRNEYSERQYLQTISITEGTKRIQSEPKNIEQSGLW